MNTLTSICMKSMGRAIGKFASVLRAIWRYPIWRSLKGRIRWPRSLSLSSKTPNLGGFYHLSLGFSIFIKVVTSASPHSQFHISNCLMMLRLCTTWALQVRVGQPRNLKLVFKTFLFALWMRLVKSRAMVSIFPGSSIHCSASTINLPFWRWMGLRHSWGSNHSQEPPVSPQS